MRHEVVGEAQPGHMLCRYGNSRIVFRGPRRAAEGRFVAFVGGSETFGRFVDKPFPHLVEEVTGLPSVNLGCVNASIEAFVQEPAVWALCQDASLNVVQVMDAHNLSNRFYTVHPRRNDRFLRASSVLQALYPTVDFTEFCFTRHMLSRLLEVGRDRFGTVRAEIQAAWLARMHRFLAEIGPRTVLLWLSQSLPSDLPWEDRNDPLDGSPLFVSRAMVEALRSKVRAIVMVQPSARAQALGTEGMLFQPGAAAIAAALPNPATHREIAEALMDPLRRSFGPL